MRTKVYFWCDAKKNWRWRITYGRRIIAASSEGYRHRRVALKNLCTVTGANFRLYRIKTRAQAFEVSTHVSLGLLRMWDYVDMFPCAVDSK